MNPPGQSLASRWGGLGDTRRGEFHPVKKVFLATMLLRQFEHAGGIHKIGHGAGKDTLVEE